MPCRGYQIKNLTAVQLTMQQRNMSTPIISSNYKQMNFQQFEACGMRSIVTNREGKEYTSGKDESFGLAKGDTNLVGCSIVTKTYVSIDPENLFHHITFSQLKHAKGTPSRCC